MVLLQERQSLVFEVQNHYSNLKKAQRRLIIAFFSEPQPLHFLMIWVQFIAYAVPLQVQRTVWHEV